MRMVFILFAIIFSCSAYACDCSPVSSYEKSVHLAFNKTDQIVLGIVKYEKEETVYLEVLETYKGKIRDSLMLIEAKNSCSRFLRSGETWLLYLNETENGFVSNECLPNRLFPKMNLLSFPAPKMDSGTIQNDYQKSILLYQELISLRQRKLLLTEMKSPKNLAEKSDFYLVIMLGINLILLLIIFFRKS